MLESREGEEIVQSGPSGGGRGERWGGDGGEGIAGTSDPVVETTVTDFIFLGSKVTVDGDCSCEIKRHLLLGRNAMTNLDSILKSRHITLLAKSV